MHGPDPLATSNADAQPAVDLGAVESTGLTITDAARTFGTGRRLIRARLHAGEFPNAAKDTQGFWRIPESDLRAAGLARSDEPADAADRAALQLTEAQLGELQLLRIEVLELRHRVETTEALLEAERRLSEERARALEAERATVEALYIQSGIARPAPKVPERPRVDWQANMRAARDRDLRMRAQRDAEIRQHAPRPEPKAEPPASREMSQSAVAASGDADTVTVVGESSTMTETMTPATAESTSEPRGAAPSGREPERRHRWRRR